MGSIVIFIAVIFVAAIAAGVLIQTTSSLTSKALATGSDAKGQVSTSLAVRGIYGNDGLTNTLDEFYIDTQLASGSDAIKLSNLMVKFETSSYSETMEYNETVNSCNASSVSSGNYNVAYLLNSTAKHTSGYIQPGDVTQICFGTENIVEGEAILFNLIPKEGQVTTITTSSPNTYSRKNVPLYP